VVAEACVETNDLSDHDRRVLARSSAKFASEVFQFTLTCSHGPIFICFVCVTGSPVAVKQPHLQSIVQQMFSKQLPAFPHSDGTVLATIPAGRQPSRKFTPNSINTSAFGFTGRAQSSPPPFTPCRERASGKALAFLGRSRRDRLREMVLGRGDCQTPRKSYKTTRIVGWVVG